MKSGGATMQSEGGRADVDVRDVVKTYDATRAVDGVSFGIPRGRILSLLGPSGCGKTTVMRMIAGLVAPDAGDIHVGGRAITSVPVHRRNVGMLFQSYALFPHLDVSENIAFGLKMRGVPSADAKTRVQTALDMVRLAHLASRMPHQLSGGQQQRVALARALVIEPSALLLDEPFGALDKQLRESMQIETRQIQQRLGITTLMVTHDQEEALTLSDEVAVMRAGRIEQIGSPREIYERPVSRFVASFIGTSNFLDGIVTGADSTSAKVETPDGVRLIIEGANLSVGALVTVALRPEAVTVSAGRPSSQVPNQLVGLCEQVIYKGLNTHVLIRPETGLLFHVIMQNQSAGLGASALTPGEPVTVQWTADRNHVVRSEA